jgi:hypothetical protein
MLKFDPEFYFHGKRISGEIKFTRGNPQPFVCCWAGCLISVKSSCAGGTSEIPRGAITAILRKNPAPPWDAIDVRR